MRVGLYQLSGSRACLDGDDAKDVFDILELDATAIEKNIGTKLEWKKLPEGKQSRIIAREKLDPTDRDQWKQIFKWYADTVDKYREAFLPRLKAYDS